MKYKTLILELYFETFGFGISIVLLLWGYKNKRWTSFKPLDSKSDRTWWLKRTQGID